jgi:nucleotide sugar dehydrogenase
LKVSVIGLGVGYALACCFAEAGYKTVGVDIDQNVVANPRSDASVGRLLAQKDVKARIHRNLKLTTDYSAIAGSSFVIVCVSTGDEKKLILGHVKHAVRQALRVLRAHRINTVPLLMVYSTLPFASSMMLRDAFRKERVKIDKEIGYVHFPLMIAQGTTAYDFVNPPFVVFGSYNPESSKRAMRFYVKFIKRSRLFYGKLPPMFSGTPEEAELAKLSANAYLTTKIALANEIGSLCERLNINGQKVMEIVGSDWRIGKKFTKPGYAVGGQCFPRDLRSLIETFRRNQVEPQLLSAVNKSNESRVLDPLGKIEGHNVLIMGTSYKAGVRDDRGSQVHKLVFQLRRRGYSVSTYDSKISVRSKIREGSEGHDTVIVMIPEGSFRNIGKSLIRQVKVVLDYANIVDTKSLPPSVSLWRAGRGWSSQFVRRNTHLFSHQLT